MNKRQASVRRILSRAVTPIALVLMNGVASAAGPAGERVVAGAAAVSRAGNALTVKQTSSRAVIEWSDFSLSASQSANFVMPDANSAVLNRVTGGQLSQINGALKSNGKVYLINPNGVIVGNGATIRAQSFIASTLDVSDGAFMAADAFTLKGDSNAAVVNFGSIEADGGNVVLVARRVENHGDISAAGGQATLAGGTEVWLRGDGDEVSVRVAGEGSVENSGVIQSARAQLLASGGNTYALAINNSGVVRATGVKREGGKILLTAGGNVRNSGELTAQKDDGAGGDINIDAGATGIVEQKGVVNATAGGDGKTGGKIVITGWRVGILDDSTTDASGTGDGGTVHLGGGLQGQDPAIRNADALFIGHRAVVRADAGAAGRGGRVIAWSDHSSRFYGKISARGGIGGGDGGFVETSGGWIDIAMVPHVQARALAGIGGTWLIDPTDLTIVAGSDTSQTTGNPSFEPTGGSAQLGVDAIYTALQNGSAVTISTSSATGQAGNITWSAALDFNGIGAGKSLTLNAHNDIFLSASISSSGGGADSLNLTINPDSDGNGGGAAVVNNAIATGGGSITFTKGVVLKSNLNTSTNQTGRAGGNISFAGALMLATGGTITLTTTGDTGDGGITFGGGVDSGNQHDLVTDQLRTWDNARTAAASGTGSGTGDTYLATVTSALENSMVRSAAGSTAAWLGGSDAASEGAWRWVTGPEGLEAGGGRQFWQGNASGSTVNGSYANWNTNEPNNSGGLEHALQLGAGAAGQWNDLRQNTSTLYYVRETNLTNTSLTINAGSRGAVSFAAAVGASKPLANMTISNAGTLTTTAAADITLSGAFQHNGAGTGNLAGDITTTGGSITLNRPVAINTAVTFYAGGSSSNVVVNNAITKSSGGDSSITLRADNDIFLNSGSSIASTSGALDVTINADRDGGGAGGIKLDQASITSNGGDVLLSGGATPATGRAASTSGTSGRAVYLITSTISAGAGDVTLRGRGASAGSFGVDVVSASSVQTTTGNIRLDGVTDASGSGDFGISIYNGASIGSQGGDIFILGSTPSTGPQSHGVNIELNASVTNTGGRIIVLGQLTGNSANPNRYAVHLRTNSTISVDGAAPITLTANVVGSGTGIQIASGSNRIGTGSSGSFSGDLTLTSDTMALGNVTIAGRGTLTIQPYDPSTTIGLGDGSTGTLNLTATELTTLADGFSSITIGRGNTAGALSVTSATFSDPLTLQAPDSAGSITVNGTLQTGSGTGAGSITLLAGDAITLSGGTISTQGQTITLNSDVEANTSGPIVINSNSSINSNGGNVILGGGADPTTDNAYGAGSNVNGILIDNSQISAGAGTVTLHGRGLAGTANANGVSLNGGTIATTSGGVNISGVGGAGSGDGKNGVLVAAGSSIETDSGDIVIDGQANVGNGGGNANSGINLDGASTVVQTTSGEIKLTGFGAGTGSGNHGVLLNGGATVQAADGGSITATGQGSLAGLGSNNEGVKVQANSVVKIVAGAGDLTLNGTGGTGVNYNVGVNVRVDSTVAMESSATGTLTLSGTGGAGSGTGNWGVLLEGNGQAISMGAADIVIDGIGGTGSDNHGFKITGGSANQLGHADMTGDITINADTIDLEGFGNIVVKSSGALTIRPRTASTSIGLGDGASGTLNLNATELSRLSDGFSLITIGRSDGTGAIAVNEVAPDDNVRLLSGGSGSGGISIHGEVHAGTNTVELATTGAITQSAPIIAGKLLVTGASTTTLNDADNEVSILAAGVVGDFEFANAIDLSIGTVNSTSGVASGGTVQIGTAGSADLTLDQVVVADAAAGANAIVLSAGGDFINNVGASALDPGAGRFVVYSGSHISVVRGGLSGVNRYGKTIDTLSPGTVPGTGDTFVFATAPTITITADGKSKVYGDANPSLTLTTNGLLSGDDLSTALSGSPLVSTAATTSSGVGTYAITPAAGTLTSPTGYQITFAAGTLTVTPAPLTIAVADASKVYGDAMPSFAVSYDGFVGADDESAVTGLSVTSTANASSGVGSYSITASGAAANYDITFTDGTLTVTPAQLTISVADTSKVYGDAMPNFAVSYDGFVAGDDESVVTNLNVASTADASSGVGSYNITPSGASAANYDITFTGGTLTVTKAPLTLHVQDHTRPFLTENPLFAVDATGLVNGDTLESAGSKLAVTSATPSSPQGDYPIELQTTGFDNYDLTLVPGVLRVEGNPKGETARATSQVTRGDMLVRNDYRWSAAVFDHGDVSYRFDGSSAGMAMYRSGNVEGSHIASMSSYDVWRSGSDGSRARRNLIGD